MNDHAQKFANTLKKKISDLNEAIDSAASESASLQGQVLNLAQQDKISPMLADARIKT